MIGSINLYKTSLPKTSVTLVAPGLNVKPPAMMELIKVLHAAGSDAYLISFSHVDFQQKNLDAWEDDFMEGYKIVRSFANEQNLPLFFLGYSLGALLGQYLFSVKTPYMRFDKQVLIAPATAIRLPGILKSFINILGNNLKIPSYTPKGYRLDNWLPAKVYKGMIKWESCIANNKFAGLNIPTLIVIDPKDELISFRKIRKQIMNHKLTNHQCIVLQSDLKGRRTRYHHLMIDEATMGNENWSDVTKKVVEFISA